MNKIREKLNEDGTVAIDEFGQLIITTMDSQGYEMTCWPIDVRGRTCGICGEGWELTPESVKDQYHHGQAGCLVHVTCLERYLQFRQRIMLMDAIAESGFMIEEVRQIENQYWGAWNTCWYKVKLVSSLDLVLTFGSRKRVFHVGLEVGKPESDTDLRGLEAEFEGERVTKGFDRHGCYLHAHSDEKVAEYIAKMSGAFELPEKKGGFVSAGTTKFRMG